MSGHGTIFQRNRKVNSTLAASVVRYKSIPEISLVAYFLQVSVTKDLLKNILLSWLGNKLDKVMIVSKFEHKMEKVEIFLQLSFVMLNVLIYYK